MESALSPRPTRSLKISGQNILYGFIHLIIVTVVSLPTFFYIFHAGHPSHFNSNVLTVSNLTKSEKSQRRDMGNTTSINKDKSICNSPLIFDEQSGQCRPPCEWTTQTVLTQQAYFIVIVVGLWVALITTIITFITSACIENLRKFPHVLRFHIIVCCVILANSKMIPVHLSPKKTFCRGHMFWLPEGQSSIATVVSGYKFYFMDLMSAGAASPRMAYFSVTLPMQVTLGVSLCLLWSIVWHLKRARLDTTKRVIRAPEETASMRRVERQFLSMAGVMLFVLGLVLLVNTVTMYNMDNFVHEAEVYFDCLLSSSDCKSPSYNTVLSLISVVVPSFACIAFFCLLLLNKDCRQIWKDLFQKFKNVLRCCVPHPSKIRADTQRSRCSSTLTVLSERRASEIFSFNTVDPILELSHPYLVPGQVTSVKMERARSSTLDLPVMNQKMTVSDASVEIRVTPPSDNDNGGSRVRCNSVPAFASTGKAVQHKNLSAQLLNSQSRDSSATSSNSSLESDLTDEIIQDIDHYTSKL
ncbi:uncharacterized protein LOC141881070 isoform X2 [Acropora palmata]|uniref:uncharacterized protein LOC141881070 isoform X2 n=1 Tax=Acropora palmata TaxID=6131 RepID=UPI003D9FBBD5